MIYDSARKWVTPLTNITFLNNNEHGIYLKVSGLDEISTAEWLVSEAHIDPLRDDDYIIYKLGRALPVVDGVREVEMLWGNVKPRQGQIQSDWNQAVNTSPDYIKNKPAIPSGSIALTGDVTGAGSTGTPFATTLATVNSNVGTFGSTTKIPVVSVDGKGRVTAASEVDAPTVHNPVTIAAASAAFASIDANQVLSINEQSGGGLPLQVTGITLLSTSWTLVTGLYEYDLANVNITVTSIVDVIPENASIAIVKAADVLPKTVSSAGSVKLYSTNAPTGDILITINIMEATI